jgi:asparaginyl-tRNA synthetase
MRTKIKTIIEKELIGEVLTISGWIKTIRFQKTFVFIEINDGSCLSNLQVLADESSFNLKELEKLTTGSSVSLTGNIVQSPGKNQKVEMQAKNLHIYGICDSIDYPLQKKRHSFEFLREISHLRPRTNTQGAVTRVRNALSYATHTFFQEKDFLYIQTPIITGSDCEGGGELFQVTSLDHSDLPLREDKTIDYSKDFFGKPTYLTVSGQLNAEIYACALSDVYTFGPTFRAENSHTSRHLAEFWMIEPEMAFADLKDDMDNAEEFLKYLINHVMTNCKEDLQFFDKFIEKGLIERLTHVLKTPFERISYDKAIDILTSSNKSFEFPVEWGIDLQSEHERYLTEEHFKKPVILKNYPEEIKAFYMRQNEDNKTVAAMDILVPKIGEIIGGSQREERLDLLEKKIEKMGLRKEDYWWYLELRKYGTIPHSGYGVGFERLVQFITGVENIRDVIPFPRYPGHADF